MQQQKRVIAIHDISCIGKCSLTVALPILSAAGIETGILPTAVLSTHTGGFEGYTCRDLTDDILPIIQHWQTLDFKIDAIYTGYLGSFEQLELIKKVFSTFKQADNLIYVDPAMADNGQLYPAFTPDFAKGMAGLCGYADIIVPNITEACFMTDVPYRDGPYDRAFIENLMTKLSELGPKKIILTGICFDDISLGAAAYDGNAGTIDYIFEPRIDGYYHGSGDVFGSAALAALMNGATLSEAAGVAVRYTVGAIRRTKEAQTDIRYGVDFERGLSGLIADVQQFSLR